MSTTTRGAIAFDDLCARQARVSEFMADLAKTYKVSVQTLYRWRSGEHQPSTSRMARLQREHGIPMEWWAEEVDIDGAAA